MGTTVKVRFVIDSEPVEIHIPRPSPMQDLCELGEPLVKGLWGEWKPNLDNEAHWKREDEKPA